MGSSVWQASWRASTSINRGSYAFNPVQGMMGLSDFNICCRRVTVADKNFSTADSVALPDCPYSSKKSKLSLIICSRRIKAFHNNYAMVLNIGIQAKRHIQWSSYNVIWQSYLHTVSIMVVKDLPSSAWRYTDLRRMTALRWLQSSSLRVWFGALAYTLADRNCFTICKGLRWRHR